MWSRFAGTAATMHFVAQVVLEACFDMVLNAVEEGVSDEDEGGDVHYVVAVIYQFIVI